MTEKPKWEKSDLQPLCTDKTCKCSMHPEFCCTQRLQQKPKGKKR